MSRRESAGLAIVFENRVLLAHSTGRGWWKSYGIPKGGIEPGETALDAAIRETYEEVGIRVPRSLVQPTAYEYILSSKKGRQSKRVQWFVVHLSSLEQVGLSSLVVPKKQLQLSEVDWAGFIDLREAQKRVTKSQESVISTLVSLGLLESLSNDIEIYKKTEIKDSRMKHIQEFEDFVLESKSIQDHIKKADQYKKELAKLKADAKKSGDKERYAARIEAKEEQLRRVADVIRNMRADGVREDVEPVLESKTIKQLHRELDKLQNQYEEVLDDEALDAMTELIAIINAKSK